MLNLHIIPKKIAKELGLKRYYTGKPCANGHLSERFVSIGRCCECKNGRVKQYYQENKEKIAQRKKIYYEENKEKARIYRDENKDRISEYRKKYNLENKEKLRIYKAENKKKISDQKKIYRAENKETISEYNKHWREENKDKVRNYRRQRRARVKNAEGSHTADDVLKKLDTQDNKCAACYEDIKNKKYHVDHITPLALGGTNYSNNLQILCPPCNRSKGAKSPEAFYQSRGFLL